MLMVVGLSFGRMRVACLIVNTVRFIHAMVMNFIIDDRKVLYTTR